jgi:HPt (histidine-containing phosphotransfer) domain-containing protein
VQESQAAIDLAAVLDRIDGDQELLRELAALYLEDERRLRGQIEHAAHAGDAAAIARAAHTLKGAVSNFCAPGAQAAALALENSGRQGRVEDARALLARLDVELGRVREALSALVNP